MNDRYAQTPRQRPQSRFRGFAVASAAAIAIVAAGAGAAPASALSLDNDILPPGGSAMPPGPAPEDYPPNMGYTPLFSVPELRREYTIRLVGADSEPFRSAVAFAAQQWQPMIAITIAPGTIAEPSPLSTPNVSEILLDVAPAKCAGNVTACTRYPTLTPLPNGESRIESGHIWLAPAVATYSTALIRTIVSHQLGHALGLAHHNHTGPLDGQLQVMNTTAQSWTSGTYQDGDLFGRNFVAPPSSEFLQRNDIPPYAGSGPWSGVPEQSIWRGYTGDVPLKGDWDGDGIDTVGIWGERPEGLTKRTPLFHLSGNETHIGIRYGNPGDRPIAGDWNGDGIDTIGVLRGDTFHLRHSNAATSGFTSFTLPDLTAKPLGTYDRLLVGDWDGDGIDTIAIRRGTEVRNNLVGSWWSFYDTNSSSTSAVRHRFGLPTYEPVVGDWDGDGTDGVGIKYESEWFLWNALSPTGTLVSSSFGEAGDMPLAGDWDGDGDDTVGTHRGYL